MRLTKNTTPDGRCKYSIINHEKGGKVEHGAPGAEDEFFVIKLKDIHTTAALIAYAESVEAQNNPDMEYADDIRVLAARSGIHSPWPSRPEGGEFFLNDPTIEGSEETSDPVPESVDVKEPAPEDSNQ